MRIAAPTAQCTRCGGLRCRLRRCASRAASGRARSGALAAALFTSHALTLRCAPFAFCVSRCAAEGPARRVRHAEQGGAGAPGRRAARAAADAQARRARATPQARCAQARRCRALAGWHAYLWHCERCVFGFRRAGAAAPQASQPQRPARCSWRPGARPARRPAPSAPPPRAWRAAAARRHTA